jgi:hypothetical protein
MKSKLTLTIALLLFGSIFISATLVPDDPFSILMKKMEEYVKNSPQEKIHLHLDKPYYAIGDDIWFKAYILDTRTSTPSTLSGALYVELINEQGVIRKQLKLPVAYGLSWGDFKLPDTLSEGNYRIRAYTQLMRNSGPELFFDKTIKIGNSWSNKVFTNANYTYSQQNNEQRVNAKIQFLNKDKTPFISNEVTYEVKLNDKSITKGTTTTSSGGEIIVGFANPKGVAFESGKIITTITLSNKEKIVKNIPLKALSDKADVQFFPEGGTLVEGLPSKIGVKAINENGLGKLVNGTILDDEGTEIIQFKSSALGMGNVSMTPLPGRKYTAKIKFEDGSEKSFNLPAASASGYALNVNNTRPDQILVKVMMSTSLLNKGELKLIAQHLGNIYLVSKANSDKQIATFGIPRKNLPSGIVQLTLFSPENLPVSERLIFINNENDQMKTLLKTDQESYTKRQEVKMNLTAMANDQPVQGSFSVSVTNMSSLPPDLENESNMLTSLLLTSDLSGYVEKPNTYFMDQRPETVQALDNLLLTQGWRRILWKNIISSATPGLDFKPEKSLAISGAITQGKKPVPNAKVSLVSSQGGFFMIDTLADENGRFVFDKLNFGDSTKFVIQARYGKDKKFVEIAIDQVPGQLVTHNKNTGDVEVNINESIGKYLQSSSNFFEEQMKKGLLSKTIQLDEIKIVGEKANPAKNSANLNGAGKADIVISEDMIESSTTLHTLLIARAPGIMFMSGLPFLSRSMNKDLSGGPPVPMMVMLDGIRVDFANDETFVYDFPVSEIQSIEILKGGHFTAAYGQQGGGGVIIITSKSGKGRAINNYVPGLVTFTPKGFYALREFYSPKYEAKNNSSNPDLRTTVYWNPNVVTNAAGQGQFSFFNTDEPGEYRVVMEGIEANGKLARQVYTYQVK